MLSDVVRPLPASISFRTSPSSPSKQNGQENKTELMCISVSLCRPRKSKNELDLNASSSQVFSTLYLVPLSLSSTPGNGELCSSNSGKEF